MEHKGQRHDPRGRDLPYHQALRDLLGLSLRNWVPWAVISTGAGCPGREAWQGAGDPLRKVMEALSTGLKTCLYAVLKDMVSDHRTIPGFLEGSSRTLTLGIVLKSTPTI